MTMERMLERMAEAVRQEAAKPTNLSQQERLSLMREAYEHEREIAEPGRNVDAWGNEAWLGFRDSAQKLSDQELLKLVGISRGLRAEFETLQERRRDWIDQQVVEHHFEWDMGR